MSNKLKGLLNCLPLTSNTLKQWPWTAEVDPKLYCERTTWPKITIVTPSFNQGHYIEATIRSILLQNYPNLEYIVIDGGSTDRTVDILRKYDPWITHWVSEPDQGQTDAINKGFIRATGLIFNWINSDDFLEPNALYHLANSFDSRTTCVAGMVNNFLDGGEINDWLERTEIFPDPAHTLASSAIRQPGTFFRTDAIRSIFPLPLALHYTMDQHLWARYLLQRGQEGVKQVPHIIVHFRRHHLSKTQSETRRYCLTYSAVFFRDYHSIHWSQAQQLALAAIAKHLYLYFPTQYPLDAYNFPISESEDCYLLERSLHYYLLDLLLDDYYQNEIERLRKGVQLLRSEYLDKTARRRLRWLYLKLQLRPLVLLKRAIGI